MREELTSAGFQELRSVEEVDNILNKKNGTILVLVNSVCGCAAGSCRPGALLSLDNEKKPDILTTVFAGQDKEATERFKDGELVHFIERHDIEGNLKHVIAEKLIGVYNKYC